MKYENQQYIALSSSQLTEKVADLSKKGYRLVQICCAGSQTYEITYSFDKGYELVNLRLTMEAKTAGVPSITAIYLAAFTYENELQDLFGVNVTDMKLNFNGNFYKTTIKTPFATGQESVSAPSATAPNPAENKPTASTAPAAPHAVKPKPKSSSGGK
ncbi:MAG: NADH-quinone oxidoreductase subunit C [Chitinivibrionales bacterium]|nr:NADH-quinone oxidoreductase subunit C [Chitinivibrionales bacterium]